MISRTSCEFTKMPGSLAKRRARICRCCCWPPCCMMWDRKKSTPRSRASLRARAKRAVEAFLESIGLEEEAREKVLYAVDVHRFSKGIVPVTLEARILQDADRLDALGAIGIARVFLTGGTLGRELYHPDDPFCRAREPDDGKWNLDHFYKKLLKLELGMHTESAKKLAAARTAVLRRYLLDLEEEIGSMNLKSQNRR